MVCLPDDKQVMRTSFHHPSACNHFIARFIMHFLRMSVFRKLFAMVNIKIRHQYKNRAISQCPDFLV